MNPSKKEFEQELERLHAEGLARTLSVAGDSSIENLSSNDYLGLSRHPDVIRAAQAALEKFGAGGTSSRLLAGTASLHQELEQSLARFLGKEAALAFSSGYHVNTGILPALTGPDDIIFFDRLCHASIIDGIRLSRASFAAFDHNDADDLENLLRRRRKDKRRAFIVTEGFFSMDGDEAKLAEICYLAEKWDAFIYLDEAHSFGLTGPDGRGLAARLDFLEKIDVFVGTLSKSLGSQGGFVATSRTITDLLVSKCRSFLFTTALAPACAAAASASLMLLPQMEDRRRLVFSESHSFRVGLKSIGYDCLFSVSPIIPVWTGTIEETRNLSGHLLSHGFFVPSIRPPTVPAGQGRVRLSVTHNVASKGMEKLLQAFSSYTHRPKRTGDKLVQAS